MNVLDRSVDANVKIYQYTSRRMIIKVCLALSAFVVVAFGRNLNLKTLLAIHQ